jgi:hypothetical protein
MTSGRQLKPIDLIPRRMPIQRRFERLGGSGTVDRGDQQQGHRQPSGPVQRGVVDTEPANDLDSLDDALVRVLAQMVIEAVRAEQLDSDVVQLIAHPSTSKVIKRRGQR